MLMAGRFRAQGQADAMSWTPGMLVFHSLIMRDEDKRELDTQAVAGRLAQATEKAWEMYQKGK